jgi:CheY-like chemotaxis protein
MPNRRTLSKLTGTVQNHLDSRSALIVQTQRRLNARFVILRNHAIRPPVLETIISQTIKNEPISFRGKAIQTLVVDSFEPFRNLTCSALKERAGVKVVGEAADGLEALRKFEELQPNLVMLDLDLPKLNGLEVAKAIRHSSSECKIVFLTLDTDQQVAQESFISGANAYLIKTNIMSELCIALEEIFSGRRYLSDKVE